MLEELDHQRRQALLHGVEEAGHQVLILYQQGFTVETKADKSPLTEADLLAHRMLTGLLQDITPGVPVLSEESGMVPYETRRSWQRYWLVDPIDGTKEFISKNGEFTLNVALIEDGLPVFGMVHAPVRATIWWGHQGKGAWKRQGDCNEAIHVRALPDPEQSPWKVVGSRSHGAAAFQMFRSRLPRHECVTMGSSLKLCLIAEGEADLYPRLGPTSEWDTAAAHAVVMAAGGEVFDAVTLEPLRYNRQASVLNPHFMVCGQYDERWAHALAHAEMAAREP